MADLLPIAIFIKDTESKLLLVNKACEAQWGMSQSDLCGSDGSQFFPSDQMLLFFAKDKEVFAGKCQVDFEETFWNATLKQNRLGHTFKNPIYDEFGQPLYLICATLDITEQKQAENYESFRSHLLVQLTEDKPLPIILENIVRGVEQYYPEMLCSIMLLDNGGKHFNKGIAPSLPDFYNTALNGMEIGIGAGSCGTAASIGKRVIVDDIATHPYWLQYRELAASAGLRACWSQPVLSKSGQILGTFAIYHYEARRPTELNITVIEQSAYLAGIIINRKQAEKDLQIAAIAFETQEGMAIINSQKEILQINQSFTEITGYRAEDVIGQPLPMLSSSFQSADFYDRIWEKVKYIGSWQGEIKSRRKNGDLYPEYVIITAVKESDKDISHYVVTIIDLTMRKYKEQQDKYHLEQLAHVTRLGLMGEMASGIAHEVNQPLCAISSYSQVSLNLINTKNPDLVKLTEIAVKTRQEALRAGQIINRMKRFCEDKSQQRSNVDMNSLINDCVTLCANGLKQYNIALIRELESNLPSIYVDQIQIEQVLINLIRNSIDALISASETLHRQIIIQSKLTLKNKIQVCVIDNGEGIDEDQQEKIMTPFYTTKVNGMGMGLSISRSLMEAHNGELKFNSRPGKGCTFYFTLPISTENDECVTA